MEFTDIVSSKRFWWLVIRDDGVDVCLKDPGYDIDLTISSDVQTLTAVWMGDTTIMKAMRQKLVEVNGSHRLRKNISGWMGSSYFADVISARRFH